MSCLASWRLFTPDLPKSQYTFDFDLPKPQNLSNLFRNSSIPIYSYSFYSPAAAEHFLTGIHHGASAALAELDRCSCFLHVKDNV
jgi:hypothetical protein